MLYIQILARDVHGAALRIFYGFQNTLTVGGVGVNYGGQFITITSYATMRVIQIHRGAVSTNMRMLKASVEVPVRTYCW